MATKTEIQAELEAAREEIEALKKASKKTGAKPGTRGKKATKLQIANRKAGRGSNMRYACDGKTSEGQCQAHFYHPAKAKAHASTCKFGGTARLIKA
jgi:hypothetical protein